MDPYLNDMYFASLSSTVPQETKHYNWAGHVVSSAIFSNGIQEETQRSCVMQKTSLYTSF